MSSTSNEFLRLIYLWLTQTSLGAIDGSTLSSDVDVMRQNLMTATAELQAARDYLELIRDAAIAVRPQTAAAIQVHGWSVAGTDPGDHVFLMGGVDANGNAQRLAVDELGRLITARGTVRRLDTTSPTYSALSGGLLGHQWEVPTGVEWEVLTTSYFLTTSASAGNRNAIYSDGTSGLAFQTTIPVNIGPSVTNLSVNFAPGLAIQSSVSFPLTMPIPPLVLPAGRNVYLRVFGNQAGDSITSPRLLVIERPA